MAGRLIGAWNPALDSAGSPINGSKLYTYIGGTTSNLATYPTDTDADAGTNANTNPLLADAAGRFGEIWTPDSAVYDLKWTDAAGAQIKLFEDIAALGAPLPGVTHRSYLAGLTLSTAGSSANMTVAPGQATDATNTTLINLAAAMTKTTGAWAAGTNQGGLDAGVIANATWYHWYAISRPDTGVVGIAFSLSASAPTTGGNIPAAYTLYRRIGSALTNGSAQWVKFAQKGDEFRWDVPVRDVAGVAAATTCVLKTLASIPLGIVVGAVVNATANDTTQRVAGLVHDANQPAQMPGSPAGNYNMVSGAANQTATLSRTIITNTAQQIYIGSDAVTAAINVVTEGWSDRRGRDD